MFILRALDLPFVLYYDSPHGFGKYALLRVRVFVFEDPPCDLLPVVLFRSKTPDGQRGCDSKRADTRERSKAVEPELVVRAKTCHPDRYVILAGNPSRGMKSVRSGGVADISDSSYRRS